MEKVEIKLLVLGEMTVGKTCFFTRFAEDTFSENHITTIGKVT